jgi:hypothetical protein
MGSFGSLFNLVPVAPNRDGEPRRPGCPNCPVSSHLKWSKRVKKEIDLHPRRHVRRVSGGYDAEIIFNHEQFIVAVSCSDFATARVIADRAVNQLKRKLRHTGAIFVAQYPKVVT